MTARTLVLSLLAIMVSLGAQAGTAYQTLNTWSEEDRAIFFAEVVRSADTPCSLVSRYMYKGESAIDAADYFTVQCPEGDFMLAFENTGENQATVVKCSIAERKGAACWEPF